MEQTTKRKRGRPKSNGDRPGWVLLRETIALSAYDDARRSDAKHEAALASMVDAVHGWCPDMPMSTTEAKRILARWRGKQQSVTILGAGEIVLEGEAASRYVDVVHAIAVQTAELKGATPPPKPISAKVKVLPLGFGPVPRYPRSNRKQS
jgi:hypothetical protein